MNGKPALLVAAVVLAGCASAPTGPSVMVLPGTNKSMEQFQADDARCRQAGAAELQREKGGQVGLSFAVFRLNYDAQGNQIPMSRPGYSTPGASAPATSTTVSPPPPPSGTPPPPPSSPPR